MASSTLAFDILARDNGASAVMEKVARATDRTGTALKKTSKISDEAAKASAALTKAHNAETTALDKVQVAEQRLAEVRANSKAKTSQVLAAEKALAKARRDAAVAGHEAVKASKDLGETLENESKQAGKGLGSGLKKWFTGDGKSVFEQIGKDGGTVFGSGLAGALKTPVLGPALIAGLGGAVAVAAPIAGSIAASGLVAGFGAGIGGLGLVFAAKSKVVQDTWSKTLHGMGADMKVLSTPFESTLISMAATAKRTFATFKPELASSFKTLAPAFTQFGDQVGRAFDRLAPALQPISVATAAVLKSLGGALPDIVGKLSGKLIELSNSVAKNPDGLKDLASGIGAISDSALDAIRVLNDLDRVLGKIPGGFSTLTKLPGLLNPVKGSIDALWGGVVKLDGLLGGSATPTVADLGKAATLTGGGVSDMGAKVAAFNAAVGGTVPAATNAANATLLANRAARALAAAFDRQAAATQRASDALAGIMGSQVDYAQALADTNAAIRENGHTHDLSTQKGRDNQKQLLALRDAANQETQALKANGDGNVAAAKHGESARQSFIKLAQQMGYTVPQAQAMAKTMIAIPSVTRTAKLQANKADLERKLASANKALANPSLTKERRAKLTADKKNAEAGIAKIQGMLGNLPKSKTVTLTTNVVTKYTTIGSRSSGSGVGGGHEVDTKARASGGPVSAGQPYLVGEHGPELIVPKKAGYVITAARTRQLRQQLNHSFASAGKVGTAADIAQESATVQAMVKNLTGGDRKLANAITAGSKKLMAVANLRVQAAGRLKAAQDKLAAAVQVKNDFRQAITDAALSFNSIANISAADPGRSLVAGDIIAQMTETLRRTQEFAANLAALRSKGISGSVYKQIAEAGVEQGSPIAQALLQGGKGAIAQVNKLQSSIASASAGLGDAAAKNLYGAGVDGAQGLVNGLLAKTKALDAASAKLANQIVAQVKKSLGIHSPSKVMEWHGSMATQGFAGGMVNKLPTVADAARQLAGTATPPARRGAIGTGSGRGGDTHITVNVYGALDATDAGQKIVQVLRREIRHQTGGNVQSALGQNR